MRALDAGLPGVTVGQGGCEGAVEPGTGGPGKMAELPTGWAAGGRLVVGSSGVMYSGGTTKGGETTIGGGAEEAAGSEGTGGSAMAPGRAIDVSATVR